VCKGICKGVRDCVRDCVREYMIYIGLDMIGFVLCINGIKRGLRHNLIVIKKKRFRQLIL
jgi:hypothetical protein